MADTSTLTVFGAVRESKLRAVRLASLADIRAKLPSTPPALIILCLDRVQIEGLAVIQGIRHLTPAPLLVMGDERGATMMTAAALLIGADDHVPLSITRRELAARIAALLRRTPASASSVADR